MGGVDFVKLIKEYVVSDTRTNLAGRRLERDPALLLVLLECAHLPPHHAELPEGRVAMEGYLAHEKTPCHRTLR